MGTKLDLPGHTLPLSFKPAGGLFPNALDYRDVETSAVQAIYTHREIIMMQVMSAIMEKPDWEVKVFDDAITAKWHDELINGDQDVTPKMIDWIVQELQCKVEILQRDGFVRVFDHGIVKSDTAVPSELQHALQEAARPLEEVPAEKRDYHPHSDNKVIDLVHPSLFPVIYGKSKILTDKTMDRDNCLASIGQGETLAVPPAEQATLPGYRSDAYSWENVNVNPFSRKFQWLPCDVELTDNNGCRIVSYINNLHPQHYQELYTVIENILAKTIPLWDETLSRMDVEVPRIPYKTVEYLPHPEPKPHAATDEEMTDEYYQSLEEWEKTQPIKLPEPGDFSASKILPGPRLNLREKFADKGLQVVVKLATIKLTPEKPEYEGGSWHVEGHLNEHICATAIYYYDSDNITTNTLAFRHRANSEYVQQVDYPQNRNEYLYDVFGFDRDVEVWYDTRVTQPVGSVQTSQGRLITFPNTMQHRVSPFSLEDRSKPGHRKILAFFLVDPNLRVISTANIPPQSEEWWKGQPDTTPAGSDDLPITLDQAKAYRLVLMEERKATTAEANEIFETGEFNLCEH